MAQAALTTLIFAVMRKQAIKRALTFDRHFTQAGFEHIPLN